MLAAFMGSWTVPTIPMLEGTCTLFLHTLDHSTALKRQSLGECQDGPDKSGKVMHQVLDWKAKKEMLRLLC